MKVCECKFCGGWMEGDSDAHPLSCDCCGATRDEMFVHHPGNLARWIGKVFKKAQTA